MMVEKTNNTTEKAPRQKLGLKKIETPIKPATKPAVSDRALESRLGGPTGVRSAQQSIEVKIKRKRILSPAELVQGASEPSVSEGGIEKLSSLSSSALEITESAAPASVPAETELSGMQHDPELLAIVKANLERERKAKSKTSSAAELPAVKESKSTPSEKPSVVALPAKTLLVAEEEALNKKKTKNTKEKRQKKKIELGELEIDELEAEGLAKLVPLVVSDIAKPENKPAEPKRIALKALNIKRQLFERPTKPRVHEVSLPSSLSISDLAHRLSIKTTELMKALMKMGIMATINQTIDQETAALVVEELGHVPKLMPENTAETQLKAETTHLGEAIHRAPVVTIMGHVDHGKTSLLDYIRRSQVAASEAGGITQNIGAYHVETAKGMITFLDTPGHEAFTAMRARGAKATDIVILVVAADDGVMPQTLEAIQHAKAANVPMIVAVNKIDKPGADPERIKTDLSTQGVLCEDWGGDVMFVPISAKTGLGIDKLLDTILLQAEMLELKAVVNCPAKGVVIEAKLDAGRGAVVTLLIQQGTLRRGDILLAGIEFGRVRALVNEYGKTIDQAGPSIPVEVLGLSGVPNAGDEALVVKNERTAKEAALYRQSKLREQKLAKTQAVNLENLFDGLGNAAQQTLNLIIKAGVQGSVEALSEALSRLSSEEIKLTILVGGVGGITETDVNLAVASKAIIIAFNVRADAKAKRLIESEKVDVRYYSIIYEAIDEIKSAISGMLSPEIRERVLGLALVREVFRSPKFGAIAGCMVSEGLIKRGKPIRVLRDNIVVFEGALESLRHFKEDVSEARNGTECGIGVKDYNDVQVGDQIEVYERSEVKRTLA